MKQRNKKGFQNKIEKVAKKSLNSMSLMLNIIYSLPWKTGLVWQFFSISSSNWIFPHIYRCLINSEQHFFLMNKNHSFLGSKNFRSAPSFDFICLPEIPRQPPCIWSGSRQLCLFGGGRSHARAHVLHNLASCFSFKMRVCWKIEIA